MRSYFLTVMTLLCTAASAHAETGTGAFAGSGGVRGPADLRSLTTVGGNVIRMSSSAALGGRGWVIEIRGTDAGGSEGRMIFLKTTKSRTDWRVEGSLPLRFSPTEWRQITRSVDERLAHGQHNEVRPGEVIVCADGSDQVVERRAPSRDTWMRRACITDDPTSDIGKLLTSAAVDQMCEFAEGVEDCQQRRINLWARQRDDKLPL